LIVGVILVAVYYQQRNAVGEGYDIKCEQPSEPASATSSLACEIHPSQNADQGKPKPPWWNVLLAWPEGITAWLLLLTLGVIVWQAWETRKAAQSAERQISFQSTAMRQWVNIEPIGIVTPPNFKDVPEVTLQFEVRNKTDYLVTIKKTVAEVFTGGKARLFTVSCSAPIPPEKSSTDGGYPFYLSAFVGRST